MSYLTFKDIAKELQVSLRTVSRMVSDGLPVVHVYGRVYRVHRDALDWFLKQTTRTTSSEVGMRRVGSSQYSDAELMLLEMVRKKKIRNR